ncbi:MAG: S41 family peptidase [Clostridiales Family XIII bacterium]|nr:S41 family peptidase [Clostridiales Family XIII bacterium]
MYRIAKKRFTLLLIIVFAVGAVLGGTFFAFASHLVSVGGLSAAGDKNSEMLKERYAYVSELEDYLSENYYLPVSDSAIRTGILRGLFSAPEDIYTMYYTKEELEAAVEKTNGEMSGVGLSMEPDAGNHIRIVAVAAGSPAESAGIVPGDFLKAVNGKSYNGDDITAAVAEARGEPGTEVTVTIEHEGVSRDIRIVRSNFISPSVISETLEGGIGYIRVHSFNLNTAADFEKILTNFENSDIKALIIDVRNNNGGLVDQAINMVDLLIDSEIIAYTVDVHGEKEALETTDGKTRLPYAVLIDESSISAAEIFALGIKTAGDGLLIGETTYGKGIIQKIITFREGDGARITVMQYLTPDGDPVHGIGIAPDIVVEKTEGRDAPLDKALEMLKNS